MKTKEHNIIFKHEDVKQFAKLIGDQNPIYQSLESAKSFGFNTIPLPPTMQATAYKWIEIPWELQQPIIHRKQKCIHYQRMYIDENYRALVKVTNQFKRQNLTFIQQTLYIHNRNGQLCFEGISELILGGLS